MFSFTKEQKIFDISGISIGGQPGMYPTVLFGGLFFKGEPDFDDAKRHIQTILDKDTFKPSWISVSKPVLQPSQISSFEKSSISNPSFPLLKKYYHENIRFPLTSLNHLSR